MRLDVYLADKYQEISRSLLQKYILNGYVTVNKLVVKERDIQVSSDDAVILNIPEKNNLPKVDIPIIYEDENVIVIDKPSGILSHSKGAENEEFTVSDFFKPKTSFAKLSNRPGIVHRLDRDTSGVMLGVKNEATATAISRQFSKRKVKKVYYAVVEGNPKHSEALIDLPIGRNPKIPSQFRVDASGKSAVTRYKVLKTNNKYSLIELSPSTGRTHQLRVHMAYIGTPILGDRVYGHQADRLYLHAHSLEVTLPGGERKVFVSEVPEIFMEKVL